MRIELDIPIPPVGQNIVIVPIHYCSGHVVDAGGYGFEERKTGKWINTGSGQECSCCGEIQHGYDNYRRYCPNCGEKMEVDNDK